MQFCDIIAVYFEDHTEFLNSVWTACRIFPFKADGPVIHCALKVWHGRDGQSVERLVQCPLPVSSVIRDTGNNVDRLTTTVCLVTSPCCLCICSIPQITGNLTAIWHNKTFERRTESAWHRVRVTPSPVIPRWWFDKQMYIQIFRSLPTELIYVLSMHPQNIDYVHKQH